MTKIITDFFFGMFIFFVFNITYLTVYLQKLIFDKKCKCFKQTDLQHSWKLTVDSCELVGWPQQTTDHFRASIFLFQSGLIDIYSYYRVIILECSFWFLFHFSLLYYTSSSCWSTSSSNSQRSYLLYKE